MPSAAWAVMGERAEVAFWLLKTLAGLPAPVWTAKNPGSLTALWHWSHLSPLWSGFQIGKCHLSFPLDTEDSPSRPGAWFRLKRQKRGAAGTVYLFPHLCLGSCPLGFVSQGLCLVAVTPEGGKLPGLGQRHLFMVLFFLEMVSKFASIQRLCRRCGLPPTLES